jgi:hypothetical protein
VLLLEEVVEAGPYLDAFGRKRHDLILILCSHYSWMHEDCPALTLLTFFVRTSRAP